MESIGKTVTPDYKKYLDPAVISKISGFDLKARLIVEGFLLGLHRSPYHGFSIEFSQHRQYMQGDPLKDVDWKVYAKTDKYFIKQYEEETNLKSIICLDTSKSMAYCSEGNVSKFEYGSMLAAALGYLMLRQQDAVGLLTYSDVIRKFLPPKVSGSYLREILAVLAAGTPDSVTNTAASLHIIAEKLQRRGLVIVISDFFDNLDELLASLKHFRFMKHEVLLFQVLDPAERFFSFDRDAVFRDLETGEEITTQPYHIKKAYREAMDSFISKLKHACFDTGIEYTLIDTSTSFDKALFAYLQKRSRLH